MSDHGTYVLVIVVNIISKNQRQSEAVVSASVTGRMGQLFILDL